jgi:hypothetical protein
MSPWCTTARAELSAKAIEDDPHHTGKGTHVTRQRKGLRQQLALRVGNAGRTVQRLRRVDRASCPHECRHHLVGDLGQRILDKLECENVNTAYFVCILELLLFERLHFIFPKLRH